MLQIWSDNRSVKLNMPSDKSKPYLVNLTSNIKIAKTIAIIFCFFGYFLAMYIKINPIATGINIDKICSIPKIWKLSIIYFFVRVNDEAKLPSIVNSPLSTAILLMLDPDFVLPTSIASFIAFVRTLIASLEFI